jgi:ubiquitin-like 1-activating enzyme E1 B
MFLRRIVKKELGFAEPTVMIGEDIVYEEGEDIDPSEYAANLAKKLVNLPGGGAGHGSALRIEDFTQDLEVEVSVSHRDRWIIVDKEKGGEAQEDDREEIEKFEIGGKKPAVSKENDAVGAESNGNVASSAVSANEGETRTDDPNDSDDDIELIVGDDGPKLDGIDESKMPPQSKEESKKRSMVDQSGNGVKKAKMAVDDSE